MKPSQSHEWSEQLDGFSTLNVHSNVHSTNKEPLEIIRHIFETTFLLVAVGILAASLSVFVTFTVSLGNELRDFMFGDMNSMISLSLYCCWAALLAGLSCNFTQKICPHAVGGGLPEVKAILSGVIKPVLLSKRLIAAKVIGLTFALLAGFSVGKEGPFVQISAAIADQLLSLPCFRHLRRQHNKRLEILACGCAGGVSATFGTAFGGMLFSIEFTSVSYMVKNLPKAFLTSLSAMIVYKISQQDDIKSTLESEGYEDSIRSHHTTDNMTPMLQSRIYITEIFLFSLVGIVSGLLGVLFIYTVEGLSQVRNKILKMSPHKESYFSVDHRRYLIVCGAGVALTAIMCFDPQRDPLFDHSQQYTFLKSILAFAYKFTVTAVAVTLPLPVGLFTPVFITGSILGRLLWKVVFTYAPGFSRCSPWEFALVGAASFTTGVTRGISTAIIVYELSGGEPDLIIPLSVSILTAYFIGNRFSKNVYDVLSDVSSVPSVRDLPRSMYPIPVSNVMLPLEPSQVLTMSSSYREGAAVLNAMCLHEIESDMKRELVWKSHCRQKVIPLVVSQDTMVLMGAVMSDDLIEALAGVKNFAEVIKCWRTFPVDRDDETVVNLNKFSRSSFPYSSHQHRINSNQTLHPYGSPVSLVLEASSSNRLPLVEEKECSREYRGRKNSTESSNSYYVASHSPTPSLSPIQLHVSPTGNFSFFEEDPLEEVIHFAVTTDQGQKQRSGRPSSSFGAVAFDPSPYQVVETMQLCKVDNVFRMLKLNQAFVTSLGKLTGVVTRHMLREYVRTHTSHIKHPLDRCKQLCQALGEVTISIWQKLWREDEYIPIPDNSLIKSSDSSRLPFTISESQLQNNNYLPVCLEGKDEDEKD